MFEELLAYLDESGVRFVVVGGVAVVLQGHARLTADVDLAIDLGSENVLRIVEALTARGFRPLLPLDARAFADEMTRQEWIDTHDLEVFSMRDERNPLLTVDLFAREPIPFEELWSGADTITLGGRPIHVASIEHLIRMKRAAARPQDTLDIAQLEAISRKRHGH
jgi:predicted nucleotidyltransferase